MSFSTTPPSDDPRLPAPVASDPLEAQAAAWRDLLHDQQVTGVQREAFEQWRRQSPRHAEAYARIERGWARVECTIPHPELRALEHQLLSRVALRASQRQRRASRWRWMALAAGLLVICTGGVLATGGSLVELRWMADRTRHALAGETLYRTTTGERLSVSLSDGSTLTLNTRSRAAVRYRDGRRNIILLEGQALFDVAHDAQRPFVVTAGNRRVTALGTVFDVHLASSELRVTLIQGRVSVEAEAAAPSTRLRTELAPGEQFVASLAVPERRTQTAFPAVRPADVERAVSWKHGQVHFDGDPLRDVIRELNRYSERQFVLADERLSDLHISGTFNTSNTGAFIDMLTGSYLPVRIVEADDARIVLGYRG